MCVRVCVQDRCSVVELGSVGFLAHTGQNPTNDRWTNRWQLHQHMTTTNPTVSLSCLYCHGAQDGIAIVLFWFQYINKFTLHCSSDVGFCVLLLILLVWVSLIIFFVLFFYRILLRIFSLLFVFYFNFFCMYSR